ncbi:MAG: AI-2E family transporter [Bacteroidales bacterium]|nr:AI-2E family transporter [Bacteroidales bacterium]
MNKFFKYSGLALSLIIVVLLIWKFTFIFWYIVIAAVISFIGAPMVTACNRIHIGKKNCPNWLSALMSLLVIVIVALSLVAIFVPLIVKQANAISSIDFSSIMSYLKEPLDNFTVFLQKYGIIAQDTTLLAMAESEISGVLNMSYISNFVAKLFSTMGSLFMAVFSIIFISFFFLKDDTLFTKLIMIFVPDNLRDKVSNALRSIKKFLSRYFIGLVAEVMAMFALESIGLTIIGVKGALLIAIVGGFCNIIPYVGPIIGGAFGVIVGMTTLVNAGAYDQILLQSLLIILVFGIANTIDNMVLQPLIFSHSVDAHPLEIFIVILIFGSMGGLLWMILAIPGYTVIRVIAKEFLSNFELIRKWTSKIKTE